MSNVGASDDVGGVPIENPYQSINDNARETWNDLADAYQAIQDTSGTVAADQWLGDIIHSCTDPDVLFHDMSVCGPAGIMSPGDRAGVLLLFHMLDKWFGVNDAGSRSRDPDSYIIPDNFRVAFPQGSVGPSTPPDPNDPDSIFRPAGDGGEDGKDGDNSGSAGVSDRPQDTDDIYRPSDPFDTTPPANSDDIFRLVDPNPMDDNSSGGRWFPPGFILPGVAGSDDPEANFGGSNEGFPPGLHHINPYSIDPTGEDAGGGGGYSQGQAPPGVHRGPGVVMPNPEGGGPEGPAARVMRSATRGAALAGLRSLLLGGDNVG